MPRPARALAPGTGAPARRAVRRRARSARRRPFWGAWGQRACRGSATGSRRRPERWSAAKTCRCSADQKLRLRAIFNTQYKGLLLIYSISLSRIESCLTNIKKCISPSPQPSVSQKAPYAYLFIYAYAYAYYAVCIDLCICIDSMTLCIGLNYYVNLCI